MTGSEICYLLLFVAVFPALWLFAAFLERVFPTASEIEAKHREQARQGELQSEDAEEQSAPIESKRPDKRGGRPETNASKEPRGRA
jgi:hypothetical protein